MRKTALLTILFIFASVGVVSAESITFTSYYPSPSGNFAQIRLIPISPLGDPCDTTTIFSNTDDNDKLYMCQLDDIGNPEWQLLRVWKQIGDDIFLNDATTPENKMVGIGISAPVFKLHLDQDAGIIAQGTYGSGVLLPKILGTRFFWYPRKAALRAGNASGTQWDDAQIGNYSVAFGLNNLADNDYAVVAGGQLNISSGSTATISGGSNNVASGAHATVGGGSYNEATADYAVIAGGAGNTFVKQVASGQYTTIAGGSSNTAQNNYSSILGGRTNTTSANYATIGGGGYNVASGTFAVVGGGGSTIPGEGNTASGDRATISGGFDNLAANIGSTVGGGYNNQVTGDYSTVSGGGNTVVTSGNIISNSNGSTIAGGIDHEITDSPYSVISGGLGNSVATGGLESVIGGGSANVVGVGVGAATIGGGWGNQVLSTVPVARSFTVIAGGSENTADGLLTTISGGQYNTADFDGATIGGGKNNTVNGASDGYSTVGGGEDNTVTGDYSVIPGGFDNTISGDYSWAFGRGMTVSGDNSFMFGDDPTATRTVSRDNVASFFPDGAIGTSGGSVGIGTVNPGATLEVDGNIMANLNDIAAVTPMTYDGASNEIGYDVAEKFYTSEVVEVGDVLVINDSEDVKLKRSLEPYDTTVAGIVSAAPAILFEGSKLEIAPTPGKFQKGNHPPVALAGRVPCKVSLENGPIQRGDLLTTSSTPGHAMKATDRDRSFGAIIGKALQAFDGGENGETTGAIMVIISLQ